MDAAEELGEGVRVVSMPCMEAFDRQSDAYKAEVLPPPAPSVLLLRLVSLACGISMLDLKERSLVQTSSVFLPPKHRDGLIWHQHQQCCQYWPRLCKSAISVMYRLT